MDFYHAFTKYVGSENRNKSSNCLFAQSVSEKKSDDQKKKNEQGGFLKCQFVF